MSVDGTSRPSALAVLQVDDEFKFGRLHGLQVSELRALEIRPVSHAGLAKPVQRIGPVAHQLSGRGERRCRALLGQDVIRIMRISLAVSFQWV